MQKKNELDGNMETKGASDGVDTCVDARARSSAFSVAAIASKHCSMMKFESYD